MTLRTLSLALAGALTVACAGVDVDSSAPASSSATVLQDTVRPATTSAVDDDVVEAIDELVGTFWRPVALDGEAIDVRDGDFWEFFDDGAGISIAGFDGCNGFATSLEPGGLSPRLDAGVLLDIQIGSEAAGCGDGIDPGPYPRSDDLVRLVDSGHRLVLESDGAVRVELQRVDSHAATGERADRSSFSTLNAFSDIVRAYWRPIEHAGESVPSDWGAYWRLGGRSNDVSLSGFDGCNRFRSSQSPGDPSAMTEGVLPGDVSFTTALDCADVSTARPLRGDMFEISDDGTTIRVGTARGIRLVLERVSEEPLGSRLRPEEERAIEQQMETDQRAETDRIAEETQASVDQLRAELETARARWDAAGFDDYVVDFDAGCLECAPWPTEPTAIGNRHTVVVEGGVGSGPWLESTVGASVEQWFEYLDAHLQAGGFAQATFDPDLGHPTLLYVALAGPAGADEPVGVDEAQLSDVRLTPSELFGDDLELIGQLVTSAWLPVGPNTGDAATELRQRQWSFSTIGSSLIIAGFDGCNSFGELIRPEERPGRLVDGVLADFDVVDAEAVCPDGVVRLPAPLTGDRLVVIDEGARLEVVRDDRVLIEFVRAP